jgi:hypothetical protein
MREAFVIDTQRETYRRLMAEIEALEEQIERAEQEDKGTRGSPRQNGAIPVAEQLTALKMRLAEKRGELERLSDGCGRPHLW